jgi:hypothetical protein
MAMAVAVWTAGAAIASEHADVTEPTASRRDRQILRNWTVYWSFLIWPAGSAVSVCFFDRDAELREVFADAAADWARIANIRFDLGAPPGYRSCDAAEPSDIRVDFRAGSARSIASGSSVIGTLSLHAAPGQATLFVASDPLPGKPRRSRADMRPIVLHEIGHALGLPHEHQHPTSPCAAEYRWKEVCRLRRQRAARNAMAMDANRFVRQMREQILPHWQPVDVGLPPYDVDSIMHYRFPVAFLRQGDKSGCFAKGPRSLSAGDRARMQLLYPADPRAQQQFLRRQIDVFRMTLARSGLSRPTAARLAAHIQDQLRWRHGALALDIDVSDLGLPPSDTGTLEQTLAPPRSAPLPAECRPRSASNGQPVMHEQRA